ncbi:TetR/AcrR family transcriptional regulator [Profundibacterium mesophilum]|uniref:Transcriptional regulatory protein n=1 Tax=Profundibacterium mesophilum KAUST100406-0324 TaxID=1037889 RepID=A0A921NSN0_9RHOB|nr:TetR/AcrR family transcriptional regulator [Profundibacterium mesophilum]KAF0677192.1 Transcriptional regulatory protein [Profundibacterium mesophilum KAUST100406-0324]
MSPSPMTRAATQTAATGTGIAMPSLSDLCRSVLDSNREKIAIQKPDVALRKLELILTSALELSNGKGFQAMSLRDLSRASGISMGGLYQYFDSKTTLLKMILSGVSGAVEGALADPPPEVEADPRAHLLWLIDTHVRLTEQMLPWFTFSYMEAKNFPLAERRAAIDSEALTESYFANVIARGIASGAFAGSTSPLMPALIKPLLQEWYVKRAKYRRRGVTIETYIATVQQMVLDATGAKALETPPGG